jgi:DNA-directed RNA polymerase specialized sigma24 family protein
MTFKEMPEHELCALPDDELIAYLVAARKAGRLDQARRALGCFAFRRIDDLIRRALSKVESRADAEELAMQTIEDVLESAFEGISPGEAVNLMKTILARRIADFYRERERRPPPGALPEDQRDEERRRPDAAVSGDDKGVVEVQDAIDREYEKLQPHHRLVVDLRVFQGSPSKETAAMVNEEFPNLDTPMTDQNVDQIASRFRRVLRGELDDDG